MPSWSRSGARVDGMAQPFAAGMRLLILTGARRSEIFEAARRAGARRHPAAGGAGRRTTRAGSFRCRRLPSPSSRPCPGSPDSPWLLTIDGKHPFSNFASAKSDLDRRILAARGADGAKPMPAWRIHDLRRSVATGLQRLGVRLEVIEAVLGHMSGSRAGIVGVYQRHQFATRLARPWRCGATT